ncbi:hypothetical protein K469DRAFT_744208 [Zopfia rhizophila CBS 207.26]|uniref:Uncharacterized protein n=1 Tax=Zopfia rhizophila CBS 207.26 TaxID=1314779 RepID=A0A6A6F0Q4_9PEZI|nr:hypothetical protein K469DRAFT_744208 [Zopfia rhizophila CBS 207.26]
MRRSSRTNSLLGLANESDPSRIGSVGREEGWRYCFRSLGFCFVRAFAKGLLILREDIVNMASGSWCCWLRRVAIRLHNFAVWPRWVIPLTRARPLALDIIKIITVGRKNLEIGTFRSNSNAFSRPGRHVQSPWSRPIPRSSPSTTCRPSIYVARPINAY